MANLGNLRLPQLVQQAEHPFVTWVDFQEPQVAEDSRDFGAWNPEQAYPLRPNHAPEKAQCQQRGLDGEARGAPGATRSTFAVMFWVRSSPGRRAEQ